MLIFYIIETHTQQAYWCSFFKRSLFKINNIVFRLLLARFTTLDFGRKYNSSIFYSESHMQNKIGIT